MAEPKRNVEMTAPGGTVVTVTETRARDLEARGYTRNDGTTSRDTDTTDTTTSDAGVPDGTVDEVTAWIGDDAERAQAALDVEQGPDGKDRVGVVEYAERVLDASGE